MYWSFIECGMPRKQTPHCSLHANLTQQYACRHYLATDWTEIRYDNRTGVD